MRLLGARLLVRPEFTKDVSMGGIIIPDAFKEKTQEAIVVQVGTGYRLKNGSRHPLSAKVGDRLLYGKRAGVEVEVAEEKLLIINDMDVVAIIKGGKG